MSEAWAFLWKYAFDFFEICSKFENELKGVDGKDILARERIANWL